MARFLQAQGYTQVAVLKGGWQAWVEGGHPTVTTEMASSARNLGRAQT